MVASPNVDFGGANGLANFLQDQQRQIDEIGRQSKYPFSAGPMGTFQIYPDPTIVDANGQPVVDTVLSYGDGTPAVAIHPGTAVYGSKQQMSMYDLSGNVVYRTDESAGYGLSAPIFNYPMGVTYAGTTHATNAAGVEVVTAQANCFFYNPVVYVRFLVVMTGGWSGRFKISDGNTSVFSSSSSFTNAQYIEKMLLLPAAYINAQNVILQFLVTPSVASTTEAYPQFCAGRSKSAYDNAPGWW